MIMDGLDTLSQIALAHADQLAILEEVQRCTSQGIDTNTLPEIPVDYDEILNTEIPASCMTANQPSVHDMNTGLLMQSDILNNAKAAQHASFNGKWSSYTHRS